MRQGWLTLSWRAARKIIPLKSSADILPFFCFVLCVIIVERVYRRLVTDRHEDAPLETSYEVDPGDEIPWENKKKLLKLQQRKINK